MSTTSFNSLPLRFNQPVAPGILPNQFATLKPADILVVLAHPDDEFFASGTLARLAQSGQSIQCVYLTSGDEGHDVSNRALSGSKLAQEREYELYSSLRTLGIDRPPILLRYPDGEADDPAYQNQQKAQLRTIMGKVRPQRTITFGPDGVYGHSDHVRAGQVTDEIGRELGLPNIYHIAYSKDGQAPFMAAFHDAEDRFFPDNWKWLPPERITDRVDVSSVIPLKVQVLKTHQTQFPYSEVDIFQRFYTAYPQEEFIKT